LQICWGGLPAAGVQRERRAFAHRQLLGVAAGAKTDQHSQPRQHLHGSAAFLEWESWRQETAPQVEALDALGSENAFLTPLVAIWVKVRANPAAGLIPSPPPNVAAIIGSETTMKAPIAKNITRDKRVLI